jgi:hypothetical protein
LDLGTAVRGGAWVLASFGHPRHEEYRARMLRRTLFALAPAIALLYWALPAQALIRPQKGMAGVRLDMTQAQMRAVLGNPTSVKQGFNDFGSYTQFLYPHRITVTFQGNQHVTGISTKGRSERTARGVGVGSTENDVVSKVTHARCDTIAGVRTCHVGNFRPGSRVTVFLMSKHGHVSTVTVGFVVD